jgi:hypothetical protein
MMELCSSARRFIVGKVIWIHVALTHTRDESSMMMMVSQKLIVSSLRLSATGMYVDDTVKSCCVRLARGRKSAVDDTNTKPISLQIPNANICVGNRLIFISENREKLSRNESPTCTEGFYGSDNRASME